MAKKITRPLQGLELHLFSLLRMVLLQGLWHVARSRLFPHSFAHTLTHGLANVSKESNLYNYQLQPNRSPPQAITAATPLGNSWCLWGWSRYQQQIWAGISKSCRGTFQTCFLLRISSQEEKCSSDRERKTDWSDVVESVVIPCTQMCTKCLGGLEPAYSQPQLRTGSSAWPPMLLSTTLRAAAAAEHRDNWLSHKPRKQPPGMGW